MRLGTFRVEGETRLGLVSDGGVIDLRRASGGDPRMSDLQSWLDAWPDILEPTRELAGAPEVLPRTARPLAPIPSPRRNVICVGRNYHDHIRQGDAYFSPGRPGVSRRPIFFTKAPTTVIGPDDEIPAHAGLTASLDYECELAAVIGRRARDVAAEDVSRYIAGYTLLNDVTARDLQEEHGQWFKGKSLDGFCPLGPYLVTADEFDGYPSIRLELRVNGDLRQDLHTRDMVFPIPDLIVSLSAGMTLLPGDILATGTGAGCGFSFKPTRFLGPGDLVELRGEGVGQLCNRVSAG